MYNISHFLYTILNHVYFLEIFINDLNLCFIEFGIFKRKAITLQNNDAAMGMLQDILQVETTIQELIKVPD